MLKPADDWFLKQEKPGKYCYWTSVKDLPVKKINSIPEQVLKLYK